jgi:hypothetical protein
VLPVMEIVCDLVCEGVKDPETVPDCDPEPVWVRVRVPVLEDVPDPVPVPEPVPIGVPDRVTVCDPVPVPVPVPVETPV